MGDSEEEFPRPGSTTYAHFVPLLQFHPDASLRSEDLEILQAMLPKSTATLPPTAILKWIVLGFLEVVMVSYVFNMSSCARSDLYLCMPNFGRSSHSNQYDDSKP